MDRNNMRSSNITSGTRSLPHMGSKRHSGNGHSGNGHSGNGHSGNGHSGNGHSARLSPPAQAQPPHQHPHPHSHSQSHSNNNNNNNNNNNINNNQNDDLINYIYDSWNKVTRELERGSEEARYYQEVLAPRQLANFRPFNLDEWWARRLVQSINRNKHRS